MFVPHTVLVPSDPGAAVGRNWPALPWKRYQASGSPLLPADGWSQCRPDEVDVVVMRRHASVSEL